MKKIVDIYIPLDAREAPCREVMAVAKPQIEQLKKVIKGLGWQAHVLNPQKPVSSVAEGLQVIRKAKGKRFINFLPGWAYPDFTVSPMWQLPSETPKLLLGSAIPDFPGAVGLLAAASGTEQVGIRTSRLFVEEFEDHDSYAEALKAFLSSGKYAPRYPKTIDVPVKEANRKKAKKVKQQLAGMVYGTVGPRSMEMWNKISEADFLKYFGIAKLGFDGLRLAKMAEKIPVARAKKAFDFLVAHKMRLDLGTNPATQLTKDMVLFQMKVYCAMLDLKKEFGLNFAGVQDQLDWIEHYPATDLTLGLLNNRLRPEGDGTTFVTATEADDGAALTMQILKLLTGGKPAGFNDLRYWQADKMLYWFVNSGALAPYFAYGRDDSLEGAWSERQTPMYFKAGGGTSSVVVRKPGVVTWARISYRDHKLYLCGGRGKTDIPSEEEWLERTARCSRDWPQWYIKLCGRIELKVNTNHPMTVFGDYLADLKALAQELGIPFECYDFMTPAEIQ